MKIKKVIKKISQISVILLFLLLIINPVVTSKFIKNEGRDSNESTDIKVYTLDKNNFNKIRGILDIITDSINSGKSIESLLETLNKLNVNQNSIITDIINFIIDQIVNNNGGSSIKKTFIISQGWNYNFNIYKRSVFQLKRNFFTFWHYSPASRTGGQSRTIILKPDEMLISKSAEAIIGRQTGFMIRPRGIYIHRANLFPKLSYSFFIGSANYVYANGQEKYEINLPVT